MPDTDMNYDENLFARVESKKEALDDLRPIPLEIIVRLSEEIRIRHTYNSNAIEGNTLTLSETKMILEEGITIGGKELKEHLEVTGNSDAYLLVEEMASKEKKIDHLVIQQLHQLVTRGQQLDSGQYRTLNVRISGADKRPSDFLKILPLLDEYLAKINNSKTHPLLLAPFVHHRFVQIHPFSDGNGRVARLLLNLFLMTSGYLPVVLKKEDRLKYYAFLSKADKGDLGPLADFILHEEDNSLSLYLSVFGGELELVPLCELAKESSYSQEYLSLRARQGVLDAVKIGKTWHSSRKALSDYIYKHQR